MLNIKIQKGHNIQISGVPKRDLEISGKPQTIAIHPTEFLYIKPKLLVKEGVQVKIGTPLFFDKKNPDIKWASPGSGKVTAIHYGPRRIIEKILIELDPNEESVEFPVLDTTQILESSKEKITEQILNAGLWPMIRQRPFNKIANPVETPYSIFVSCINSAPLAVDLDIALNNSQSSFHAGIAALSRLTNGAVHLVVGENSTSETFLDVPYSKTHSISGPHPAGNVGIQIHHIDPLKPGKIIWTMNAQHVITLGRLFKKGKFDPTIVMTIGGPAVNKPTHLKTRMGTSIKPLTDDRLNNGPKRFISGDVLTGKTIEKEGHIYFYHSSVSVLPESDDREFLGMLRLGSGKSRYSLTKAFGSFGRSLYPFNTNKNGEERAMVPINSWENVLPMDIFPNPLFRAILANDIEEMEQLGLLECDEEDFALCSFADAGKIDVGAVIRQGLDVLEAEG
ncbi:MAG: Na(+)-translocating NADH-quinone reductase subunit A [Fidelibacterota bacterium]